MNTPVATQSVLPLSPLTLPLHGMRLIEASAGTGKTFTIAALYLRLVLGHGEAGSAAFARALSPRDILVVTFTRAAAEELRGRIRSRLQDAAHKLRAPVPPQDQQDPILAALYAHYEARGERLRAVHVLQQAAESMDEAAVFTIHSWCQQVLQQHAFESGAGFNRRLQQDQQTLLETCVQDYWRSFFYGVAPAHVQWLHSHWKTPAALLGPVQSVLRHMEPLRDPQPSPDRQTRYPQPALLQQCFEQLRRLQQQCLQHSADIARWIEDVIDRDVLNKNSYPNEKLREQHVCLQRWSTLDAAVFPEQAIPEAKALEWWSWQRLAGKFKKNMQAPVLDFFVAVDAFLERFADERLVIDCIEHAAAWVKTRLVAEKQRLATMDFDDMVNDVYHVLTGPHRERLADALRTRFPIALIDEFQDTDERQYASFKSIYADADDSNNGLLLIGDPKQAIYSFRGADIFTYLQARHDTEGRHYSLDTNYRSVPALVAAVNHLFDLGARALPQRPFVFDGIPFVAVNSRPASEHFVHQGRTPAPLTLWQLEAGATDAKTYQQRMAEHAADAIAGLLQDATQQQAGFRDAQNGWRPLRAADMAILVRSRNEAAAIRDALARRGIRSVYLSERDTVFATPEARTLLAWLNAVAMPEDERLLRVALAEPQLRLSLQDLDRLQQDEFFWEAKVEQFKALRVHWQQHGVLPMLRRLMQQFGVPHHLLAQAGGERVLTNLLHLSEWLQTVAATLEGEHALIRHLGEKIRLAELDDNNEELTLRLESDEQLLKIITIHKSKGLEYPLVFLPFVCMPGRDPRPPYVYHDEQGRKQIYWDDGDASAKLAAEARFEQEQLAEDLRLFYVAVTRARHACWLGMAEVTLPATRNRPARVLYRNPLAWLLAGKATLLPEDYAPALQALVTTHAGLALSAVPAHSPADLPVLAPASEGLMLHDARQMARALTQHWAITSYTGIVWGAANAEMPPAEDSPLPTLVTLAPAETVLQEERLQVQQTDVSSASVHAPEVPAVLEGMHGFPAGARPGTFLHEILEWVGEEGFDRVAVQLQSSATREAFSARLLERCEQRHYGEWHATLCDWLGEFLQCPLPLTPAQQTMPLCFGNLARHHYQIEMEFWMALDHLDQHALDTCVCASEFPGQPRPQLLHNTLQGMLKGFVDLLCEHEGRFYVLDYKSNRLGTTHADYSEDAMRDAVLHHRYDLQYALYTLALHRLLSARLGEAYDYDTHVGGAIYLFLRGLDAEGHGVFVRRLPYNTVIALEHCLGGSPA